MRTMILILALFSGNTIIQVIGTVWYIVSCVMFWLHASVNPYARIGE